jgi:hypothetical protein
MPFQLVQLLEAGSTVGLRPEGPLGILGCPCEKKSGKLERREILPQFGTLHYSLLYNENSAIHVCV